MDYSCNICKVFCYTMESADFKFVFIKLKFYIILNTHKKIKKCNHSSGFNLALICARNFFIIFLNSEELLKQMIGLKRAWKEATKTDSSTRYFIRMWCACQYTDSHSALGMEKSREKNHDLQYFGSSVIFVYFVSSETDVFKQRPDLEQGCKVSPIFINLVQDCFKSRQQCFAF